MADQQDERKRSTPEEVRAAIAKLKALGYSETEIEMGLRMLLDLQSQIQEHPDAQILIYDGDDPQAKNKITLKSRIDKIVGND